MKDMQKRAFSYKLHTTEECDRDDAIMTARRAESWRKAAEKESERSDGEQLV